MKKVFQKIKFHKNYFDFGYKLTKKNLFPRSSLGILKYAAAAAKYQQVTWISERFGLATFPYYNPLLMGHVQQHLPKWEGFTTRYLTYIGGQWNSIYGDWDWQSSVLVTDEEQPLQQRDRLEQILLQCPEGSYGYFMSMVLGPVKSVVGSFAAATIDEFFASQIHWLKQPFTGGLAEFLSKAESVYWENEEALVSYLAGQLLSDKTRYVIVTKMAEVWKDRQKPPVPPGEAAEEEQMQAALAAVEQVWKDMDRKALQELSTELYKQIKEKAK